jgi:PiT family inorganic phosphate transporter
MDPMSALVFAAVLLLAYGNGANDNFKGVATLFGSGTTGYRRALAWATLTTLAGSLLALRLAHRLVASFRGIGLVPDVITLQPAFPLAVSLGAGLTIVLATLIGLPVSTTHALTGGLVGAGLLATAGQIRWTSLLTVFLLPLLWSPILALLLTIVVYPSSGSRGARSRSPARAVSASARSTSRSASNPMAAWPSSGRGLRSRQDRSRSASSAIKAGCWDWRRPRSWMGCIT